MKLMVSVLCLMAAMFLYSCNGAGTNNNEGQSDSLNNENSTSMENNDQWDEERRNEFVNTAALIGMTEVRAGEAAQNKSQDQDVKSYGQMLVNDHRKANQELKSISQNINVDLPDSLDRKHKNKVEDIQGFKQDEFRKEFSDMMVKDHEDAISKFEDAQKNLGTQDKELKAWVDKQLPILQKHLDQAKQLQNKNQQQ